jgi:F-box domain
METFFPKGKVRLLVHEGRRGGCGVHHVSFTFMHQKSGLPMNDLPSDLLEMILADLDAPDVLRLSSGCRHWRAFRFRIAKWDVGDWRADPVRLQHLRSAVLLHVPCILVSGIIGGHNILDWCIPGGDLRVIEWLLEHTAVEVSVEQVLRACHEEDLDMCAFLLARLSDDQDTAIDRYCGCAITMKAAKLAHFPLLELSLRRGLTFGKVAAHAAAHAGHLPVVRWLHEEAGVVGGIDVAARMERFDVVEYLACLGEVCTDAGGCRYLRHLRRRAAKRQMVNLL